MRGYSFFGDSYVYIIFDDKTDVYWARSRVLEYLNQVTGRHYRSIEAFNDHPFTDHAQVVEVLVRARTDLAMGHLAAIRARAPAPVGWGRRMVRWINGRGC